MEINVTLSSFSFLNVICQRFKEEGIPIVDGISEALYNFFKDLEELKFEMWAHCDAIQLAIESKPPEDIPNALHCFISIHDSEPFELVTDVDQQREEFDSAVTELYDNLYSLKRDRFVTFGCSNLINETFPQPLLDSIYLVFIYHRPLSTHLLQDLDSLKAMLLPPPPIIPGKKGPVNVGLVNQEAESNDNYVDLLALYHSFMEIKKKHDMCNSKTKPETKQKIENHEDNNNQAHHKRNLTQCKRQHIHDSKQIMSQLGHSNAAYKNFSTISIDKKSPNASWLKLPSISTLLHSYVLIDKTQKALLPVRIYEITPFEVSSGHSQIL
ncbi:hypothetical protein O181_105972 [Austropuccinia psidii MF-1]|uniref:Uncharacterized protein n=1 Tax=Austropuccinia psidii MF-1 TaxID=1389203 RepID=A0A9Q3PMW2_9BASI|nr:hypothetical protein [Austropuccinia psidii MF-1]